MERALTTFPQRGEFDKAWRVLEMIRVRANETWARRDAIAPSYERREKPPALEIYKRLPGTNCKQCGELTCMAFACKVHAGIASPPACKPVFEGEYAHLREPLLEICRGVGVTE